jgi:alpha-L-rhamnosidase
MRRLLLLVVLLSSVASTAHAESWRHYVAAPETPIVEPVRVIKVRGDVENALALAGGRGVATLRYDKGGPRPAVVLDFGREVGGFPIFGVASHTRDTRLRTAYSETLRALHPNGDYAGKERRTRVQDLPLVADGPLRSRHIEGGLRYMRLTLPERGEVYLSRAGIVFSPPLLTDRTLRGRFESSEDLLNRIWHAGVYTASLNQVVPGLRQAPGQLAERPVLVDGAKRDRKIWAGDLLTAAPTVYYSLHPRYVRWSLKLLMATKIPRPGPFAGMCFPNTRGRTGCAFYSSAYSLAVVVALAEYYRYTGDLDFVWQQWPRVAHQMEWAAAKVRDGLFTVTENNGATWNLEVFPGRLTSVNAMYYQALRAAAQLSDALGQHAAPTYRTRAAQLRTAVNGQLWNAQRGVYDMSTTQRGFTTQDANVLAVLSGIATREQTVSILTRLPKALGSPYGALNVEPPFPPGFRPVVSPFMGGLQVKADFEAGRPVTALNLLRRTWGYMLEHGPGGTAWERIPVHGRLTRRSSAAHAWSTGATSALSRYVLGPEPTRPGWARWRVKPHPAAIGWARGEAPTPHGPLRVDWDQRGPLFRLTVRAPRGTRGSVWLPLQGAERRVTRDGRPVPTRRQGDYAVIGGQRGSHVYAWSVGR